MAELRKSDGRDPMPGWMAHDLRRTGKIFMTRAACAA